MKDTEYNRFTELFRTYFRRVKAFIYTILKSEVEGQDVFSSYGINKFH